MKRWYFLTHDLCTIFDYLFFSNSIVDILGLSKNFVKPHPMASQEGPL